MADRDLNWFHRLLFLTGKRYSERKIIFANYFAVHSMFELQIKGDRNIIITIENQKDKKWREKYNCQNILAITYRNKV